VRGLLADDQTGHAAVWGVRLDEVARGDAAARHAAMLRLVGLKGTRNEDRGVVPPPIRTDGPRDWVVQYRPSVALVLLGTNDLHGAEPNEVFARLVTVVNPMLEVAGGDHGVPCSFIVVVSTLPLHFAANPAPPIDEYNDLLRRFNSTRQPRGCALSPASGNAVNRLACSRCLALIDGAGAAFAKETRESIMSVTYDAIHPNVEGERRIAAAIFNELIAQGLV
jgi:lysophospholipase L1-like esterase